MKIFHAAAVFLLVAVALEPAYSESRALCSDGSETPKPTTTPSPTSTPTITPAPTTPTPAPTTATPPPTPAPTLAPVDCKLYSKEKDPGAFDGVCVQDALDQKWYQHKNLTAEVPASNGGKPCVPTTVKKVCDPVNCTYKDDYGLCSVVDKGWNKVWTRTIQVKPLYGGTECPALTGPVPKPQTCDAEHYCDPLDTTTAAACRAAFAKSAPMYVGLSFSGYRISEGPIDSVWQCVNRCADNVDCQAYTARISVAGAVTCTIMGNLGQIGFDDTAFTGTMRR